MAQSERIIVIDDEPEHVQLVVEILDLCGFHDLIGTTDSSEVIDLVEEHHPDLIICDLWMPGPDGFEVLASLEPYRERTFLPVIVLTVDTSAEIRRRVFEMGAADFITKPLQPYETCAKVRNLLQLRRHLSILGQNEQLERLVAERTSELTHTLERLSQAESIRSHILANLSHELRTPLTPIIGWSTVLASGEQLDPEQVREFGEVIKRQSRSLLSVIDSLLMMVPIEAGTIRTKESDLDLVEVIAAATLPGPKADLRIDPDARYIRADGEALTHVLRHLIDNAVKFSDGERPSVEVAGRAGDQVVISVLDRGPGFGSSAQEMLAPFAQGDPTPTREKGGLGLGLYLAQSLVASMGGTLQVGDREGGGAVVSVILPRSP